ncbi:serine/arginine repetitive matrix protein 3-like [Hippopotamus amphibius kiboko]|uniref:serine/arginine repetitive matrix protein 3-like n=1 Tax=Hippopotamus amphibius kiboko TaxID=575201 RepID=UPI0025945665|nr:serine/arginine repetitive matrix protein 3-like [Hippopotamus amphibius kiboko]
MVSRSSQNGEKRKEGTGPGRCRRRGWETVPETVFFARSSLPTGKGARPRRAGRGRDSTTAWNAPWNQTSRLASKSPFVRSTLLPSPTAPSASRRPEARLLLSGFPEPARGSAGAGKVAGERSRRRKRALSVPGALAEHLLAPGPAAQRSGAAGIPKLHERPLDWRVREGRPAAPGRGPRRGPHSLPAEAVPGGRGVGHEKEPRAAAAGAQKQNGRGAPEALGAEGTWGVG